jgi:hypothetical protein
MAANACFNVEQAYFMFVSEKNKRLLRREEKRRGWWLKKGILKGTRNRVEISWCDPKFSLSPS